jgi:hypothetical protein
MIRVVTWNVNWRTGVAADQGKLLASLRPDLVFLQEVNANSVARLGEAAGLEWKIVSEPPLAEPGLRRRRLVAVGGTRGASPRRLDLVAPVEERLLAIEVELDGRKVTAVSYYAPPGVSWGRVKVDQAAAFTDWLCASDGPVIVGADANTPKDDPVDDGAVRTHWYTGFRKLNGDPGDDVLWGSSPRHPLRDCLRTWIATDPTRREGLDPAGPLAVSHYTAKRKDHPGHPRRFDSIWATPNLEVLDVRYLSSEIGALSDHAPVVADLRLSPTLS